jgi:hypothetical protein
MTNWRKKLEEFPWDESLIKILKKLSIWVVQHNTPFIMKVLAKNVPLC